MADFALGLAKTAVAGTLSKVQSAVEEESKLKEAAHQDLVYITGEFQMMQAYLKVANKERANTDEVVKTWVRQLRDLAFDVENCVEFVVHLDNDSTWAWMWRMLPRFMVPSRALDLDKAVAELKQLKARVEDVSQRNTRYNLITDSAGPIVPAEASGAGHLASAWPSTMDILKQLWAASMKQCSFCNLQDLITMRGSDLKVISLWASAGAEQVAAHIISVAYCAPVVTQEFQVRARVKLVHPFNPEEFLKTLLNQLYKSSHQKDLGVDLCSMESHLVQQELMQLVTSHRYLIILEDLPSLVEWDIIKLYLPDIHNGSRVVISTDQLGAALFCTGEPYLVSELRHFPDGRYLHAFFNKGNISIAEFFRKLGQCRVISLLDAGGDTLSIVRDLSEAILHTYGGVKGVDFDEVDWVEMTHPSNETFYHGLMNYTNSGVLETDEKLLHFNDSLRNRSCLLVINGLQSREHWGLIRDSFVLEGTRSCIIIISDKPDVVTYCEDDSPREIKQQHLALGPFTKADIYSAEIFRQLGLCRVISVWGVEGEVSGHVDVLLGNLLGDVYSNEMMGVFFDEFKLFEVDRPFNRYQFTADEPVIHALLCGSAWLVVIAGLQSREEWDSIKDTLVPEGTKSCIIIICNDQDLAVYCQNDSPRVINEQQKEANAVIRPSIEDSYLYVYTPSNGTRSTSDFRAYRPDDSHIFVSRRIKEASENQVLHCQVTFLVNILLYAVDHHGVHAVWGSTGVGKSALVKLHYYAKIFHSLNMRESYDIAVRFQFERAPLKNTPEQAKYERFGWVDVPDPFNLEEFSRRLFLDFNSIDPREMEATAVGLLQGHDPIQGCYEILRKGKYLLVIDGLQSKHDWDTIREAFFCQPTPDRESSVIVITAEERVAKHCVDSKKLQMFDVRALDDTDALNLFQQIATEGNMKLAIIKLKNAEHILPKCGGLPKIIVAVAQASSSFWENMNDGELVTKLHNDPQFHQLKGLLSWMHSYFDACPDYIKPCIFYLSVFPTNQQIRRGRLLRRWISEGYCRDTVGATAMENARRVFLDLVDLGILQEPTESAMCQINGFFREYIISQPMEDNLVFVLEGHCKVNSQRTGQHLTIMEKWDRDPAVFRSLDLSRLRSLTVFGKWDPLFIYGGIPRIRVLDLEGTLGVTDGVLEDIFGKLLSLKFISVRGCRKLRHLPCSVCGLRQLETLDISGTSIVALPSAITNLQKIQCIRAGTTDEGWTPPTPTEEDDDGMVTRTPQAAETLHEGCDGMASPAQGAATLPEGHDGMATSQPQAAATPPEGSGGMATCTPQAAAAAAAAATPQGSDGIAASPPQAVDTAPEGSDGMATRPPQAAATPPEGSGGMATSTPQAVDTPPEGSDGMATCTRQAAAATPQGSHGIAASQPQAVDTPPQGSDGMATSLPQAAATLPEGIDGMATSLPQEAARSQKQEDSHDTRTILRKVGSRASRLSRSMLRKSRVRLPHNGGIEVPAGIENMSSLQTLGVVNANSTRGKDFLKDLKKVTQLLKLRVCGINSENWEQFCLGLSSHGHLECLSVRFDQDCMDDSFDPPKTIKSLKLYGRISKLSVHIKELVNLKKMDLEMTISKTEDIIPVFIHFLPKASGDDYTILRRVCIKPAQVISQLDLSMLDYDMRPHVLKLECSSPLKVTFRTTDLTECVHVLIVHCSCSSGSRLQLPKLEQLTNLKMVCLEGFYSKELKDDLQNQVKDHGNTPVLKLVQHGRTTSIDCNYWKRLLEEIHPSQ